MMGHLEKVDGGQATGQETRIDLFLDVTGQQDAMPVHLAEQHDRHVVDPGTAIGGAFRNRAGIRPQDAKRELVDAQAAPRRQGAPLDAEPDQFGIEGRIARPRAEHPGLEDLPDGIPIEQRREAGCMILMWVGQDHDINAPIPRREVFIERHQEPTRIRPAIDQEARAAPAFNQDGVPLADVEHRDPWDTVRPMDDGKRQGDHGRRQGSGHEPTAARTPPRQWLRPPATRGALVAGVSGTLR